MAQLRRLVQLTQSAASLSLALAVAAFAVPPALADTKIAVSQFVSTQTVGFAGVDRGSVATAEYVLAHCDGFQVVGINAGVVATQMIYGQAERDWADSLFIDPTGGPPRIPSPNAESSVAVLIQRGSPVVASGCMIDADFGPEAVHRWGRWPACSSHTRNLILLAAPWRNL